MSLKIPSKPGFLELWLKEIIDECMASATERGMVYTRAAQYYYTGAVDSRASLYNKIGPFVRKLAGFLMQPTDVRFQLVYDSGEDDSVLERYQRWRRFDTMAMGIATEGLNRLFSNRSDVLRLVRDVGLGLVDRLPGLKRVFIREAAGLVGDVPKLLRGEAL